MKKKYCLCKKEEHTYIGYMSPTKEEKEYINEKIKPRRLEMMGYGLRFGVASICFAIMITIILMRFDFFYESLAFIIPLCFLDAGVCSIISGIRNEKEIECIEVGDFVLRQGKVKEIQKRNCWSSFVVVQYDDEKEDKFSFMGQPVIKDDLVYIVLANKKKIKWAVPRICRK